MHLTFTWPNTPDFPLRENFFLGAWHPTQVLHVDYNTPPSTIQPAVLKATNWFLMSNTSLMHPKNPGLLHVENQTLEAPSLAVAFRGYLVEPPIHSYSPSDNILHYWKTSTILSQHNGVFSAACIRGSGKVLELVCDAFGMAPLYYRALDDAIMFATNPRYLTACNDKTDYMAWRCLIQCGFLTTDRSLSEPIKRVPAGHLFQKKGTAKWRSEPWFDFKQLPLGTQKIDEHAVSQIERVFQDSLSRCLSLDIQPSFLPLSSGNDSRRILAGLFDRHVPFQAATVRIFQKGYRDLDAHFSSIMAQELGFSHRIIELGKPFNYAYDDYQKRLVLDSESSPITHTWAVALMRALPEYPTLFFDGLAGDVLGNSPGILQTFPELDKITFVYQAINSHYTKILVSSAWPSLEHLRTEFHSYIDGLPQGLYQVTLAYLLLRTRRTIAPWAQQMLPAGHVVVCPYLDLEYVRTIWKYQPAEKCRFSLQKACLAQYWPQFASYPGTKNIPPGMPTGSPVYEHERNLACFLELYRELQEQEGIVRIQSLLSRPARLGFWLALRNKRMALKTMWMFRKLMELVARDVEKIPCWEISQQHQEVVS